MLTVRDEPGMENVEEISLAMELDFGELMIDPPRKQPGKRFSFESEGDLLSTDGDSLNGDYQLSTSSSSDEEELRDITKATFDASQMDEKDPNTKLTSANNTPGPKKTETERDHNPAMRANSFADVLNDIFNDQPQIPDRSKLGPKPWLLKNPKPNRKYEVSNQPFVFKPKPVHAQRPLSKEVEGPTPSSRPTLSTASPVTAKPEAAAPQPESPIYDTPPSRGRLSSASSGNALSDNERSVKYPSEADTGFGSNTSSNASPNNSSNNLSLLPPGGDSREPSVDSSAANTNSAQELARAAIQALTLSKSILQGKEKESTKPKSHTRDDSLYDEVPFSPVTSPIKSSKSLPGQNSRGKNVYDDVPPPETGTTASKRKVISVPVFKPPVDVVRGTGRPALSPENLYDISRSNTKTPQNVSNDALELMYQLFGKDLTDNNRDLYAAPGNQQQIYSRPPSVKFGNDKQDDGFPSRPSSRAGSVYSEWSDCTINIPDYPESEATTVARTQVEFPPFPQVGFPPPPQNRGQNFPPNSQNSNFSTPNQSIYNKNFSQAPGNQNFPFPNDAARPQSAYARNPNPYQVPNNNPVFSNPSQAPPPMFPLHNTNYMPHEIPNPRGHPFPPSGPYPPRSMDSQMSMYGRPPAQGFAPPQRWGGFSPPRHFPHPHRHPMDPYGERRGRQHGRGFESRGRGRSSSRSRRRNDYYSDDESLSRSPSPVRRRDVIDSDAIASKSYISGYKAALKDAVLTFAQKEGLKKVAAEPFIDPVKAREEKMRQSLRRALSTGRINELPDNVALGDIRKAFALPERSLSEDELDIFDRDDDLVLPSRGRPLSRNGSLRQRGNRRPRRYPSDDDVRVQRKYRQRIPSESEHDESCDCSECEEEFETTSRNQRYHEGEMTPPQARNIPPRKNPAAPRQQNIESNSSPTMKGLRQRYMDTFEQSSNRARAPVRANHFNGRHPQDGGQGYDGRFPPEGGHGYDGRLPPEGGQSYDGRFPPDGGQGYGDRHPQDFGQGYDERYPPGGGQVYDDWYPPNGGQSYEDFRNRRAEEKRRFNYEDVRFQRQNDPQQFPKAGPPHPGYHGGIRGPPNFQPQRGGPQPGFDRKRGQFGYQ